MCMSSGPLLRIYFSPKPFYYTGLGVPTRTIRLDELIKLSYPYILMHTPLNHLPCRIARLAKSTITPHFTWFTVEAFTSPAAVIALRGGISLLMVKNATNHCPLSWFFLYRLGKPEILVVITGMRVTVISFPKASSKLDCGSEIVPAMATQVLTLVGSQCLVS